MSDVKHQPLDPQFDSGNREHFSRLLKRLEPGAVYEGTVKDVSFPDATCTVEIDRLAPQRVPGCVWAAGVLSGLLGFKTSYVPSAGTRVLILFTGQLPVYVIGCIPVTIEDTYAGTRNNLQSEEQYHNSQRFQATTSNQVPMYTPQKPPLDLMEGELQIDNLMGVGLGLLRNLARITAGDLAKVECHLMDDLVRIVSDQYKHHTAFGDLSISRDGTKLNTVWHGTSLDHEAWGQRRAQDPKVPMSGENRVDTDAMDGFLEDGRWRFSQYIGWLGNFIHLFITDPQEQVGMIAEGQFRAGKARLHVNNDGSVLVQSVADIVLEKVVAIPVPIRIRPEGDPHGNTSDKDLPLDPLKSWKPSDNSNLFEMAFQLRDYARWLNNSYALARYHQLNEEFQVPKETQVPTPDANSQETDKAAANKGISNWRMGYACYRIYRDGSVQHIDAYGNAYTSTAIGVQISSTTDILLQAAGSVNIMAGQNVNVLAQNSVQVSAIQGGIWLRATKVLQLVVTAGNMVLEAMQQGAIKFIGYLNGNNTFQVDPKGNVGAYGASTASMFFAGATDLQFLHTGHVFKGDTKGSVQIVEDQFQYPESGQVELYETMTQQALRKGELPSGGTWSFSSNAIDGRGSPWPGKAKLKTTASGDSLQKPSPGQGNPHPPTMDESQDPGMHYL